MNVRSSDSVLTLSIAAVERDTGLSKVKIGPCGGGAYCGSLVWLKPGVETPAKVGQRIFYDMKPDGTDAWKGSAFNPEDGKTYSGKMSLSGGTLTTAGCAMGGMICKSSTWTRSGCRTARSSWWTRLSGPPTRRRASWSCVK